RRTPPLARMLGGIALALAGRGGERLATLLDLAPGRSSMLRLVMTLPDPEPGLVKVLGPMISRSVLAIFRSGFGDEPKTRWPGVTLRRSRAPVSRRRSPRRIRIYC